MTDPNVVPPGPVRPLPDVATTPDGRPEHVELLEEDPAVERGERLHTSKTIARGGKTDGAVPGATPQEP